MSNPFSLEEGHVLVTGASSGIGRATAVAASRAGATVYLMGRNEQRLQETRMSLTGEGHQCFALDICDESDLPSLIQKLPKLTGVVHAAGISLMLPVKMQDRESYAETMDTNLYGAMSLSRELLAGKRIPKGASFVFISSLLGGGLTETGSATYAASKAGMTAYSQVLALELASRKIRSNAISPGMVRTPMIQSDELGEQALRLDEKRYPLGYGEPEDVANAVIYLLAPASRWVTGTNLILDGGRTLR